MDLKKCCLLVTPTSFGKNDARLKTELESQVGQVIYNPTGKPLSSAEVARLLPGVDGYIAGLDGIDRAALQCADRLKVIARYGVGVDSVDLQAAQEKNIIVTNTPGANSVSVAELTLALMLALARQIPEAVAATHQGRFPRLSGASLEIPSGSIVGLLGPSGAGKTTLIRCIAGLLRPQEGRVTVADIWRGIVSEIDALDPTLHRTAVIGSSRALRQFDFMEKKIAQAARRKNTLLRSQVQRLADSLAPKGKLQERVLCALPFLTRSGGSIIAAAAQAVDPFAPEHRVVVAAP